MRTSTARCWNLDRGHGEEDGVDLTSYLNFPASGFAETYVEKHFSDWDYPEYTRVAVKLDNETTVFCVEVRSIPEFTAIEERKSNGH